MQMKSASSGTTGASPTYTEKPTPTTVFGAIYAQAEDDFGRIERNYLNGLGWLAQAEGEAAIYSDLRARLFVDPSRLRRQFQASPAWLRDLMVAWSDGLNYFLSKHPEVHPKVILHFEPWMALSFTEGSIGGDIEGIDLVKLQEFYGPQSPMKRDINASVAAAPTTTATAPATAPHDGRRRRAAARRLQRFRDCTESQRVGTRAVMDQSAYFLLFPL